MTLNEIESQFAQLPHAIQLSLLERLAHQVRENLASNPEEWETGLSAMAADPQMQRELTRIASEFSATDSDGLGTS